MMAALPWLKWQLQCREQQDTEAEEVEDFQPIDKLQQLGINAGQLRCNLVVCCWFQELAAEIFCL